MCSEQRIQATPIHEERLQTNWTGLARGLCHKSHCGAWSRFDGAATSTRRTAAAASAAVTME